MPVLQYKFEIKLFASLQARVGAKSVRVTAPSCTNIEEMLKLLTDNYPNLKPLFWPEDQEFSQSILVLVNGRDIRRLPGLVTPLRPGDKTELFPPVSGG